MEWQPFDLHPEYPPEGIELAVLERRYGAGFAERRAALFKEAGLPYAGALEKVPNSRGALLVAELARERGAFEEIHPRLFDAYWARGRDLGDVTVLVEEGVAVGLDAGEIVDTVQEGRFRDRVDAHTQAALELGVGGVPAWLIDRRLLVPGAQPHDVFAQVLERLGYAGRG
jgi:predicted DsbA family dithiol-disulfide isomerase